MNDALNGLPLPGHRGPHAVRYHNEVFARLSQAINGVSDADKTFAFYRELIRIRIDIASGRVRLND